LYRGPLREVLGELVRSFRALNPHATFILNGATFAARPVAISKWFPDQATSAHWYRPEDLRALAAAYLNEGDRFVRDFIGEFTGLAHTGAGGGDARSSHPG